MITIDYATFCGDNMKEFQCQCGAPSCRKVIRGTDYMQPFVEELYGGHISDWVKEKRKSLKQCGALPCHPESNGIVAHK
jgi:hypothetical protein